MTGHDTTQGAFATAPTALRRRRIIGACTLAVSLGIGIGIGGPAVAATSTTGGDISAPGAEFANNAASVDQLQLTRLAIKLEQGTISPQTYAAAERKFEAEHATTSRSGKTSAQSQLMPAPDIPPPPPDARTLSLTHYAQQKNYWCGPASGAMIVKMIAGAIRSQYNGADFSQTSFAGPAHMQTEAEQSTPWGTGTFTRGVNRWLGYSAYQQVDSPSGAVVRSALRSTIGQNSRPVAADTVEFAGGKHYNGHPTGSTIGHWIVAYAYSNTGDTVRFADPSTSVWSGVSQTFSADTSTFTSNYLQSNGIAY